MQRACVGGPRAAGVVQRALAPQRRWEGGGSTRKSRSRNRKGAWGSAVALTKEDAVNKIKENDANLALHVNALSQAEFKAWQQGTRGIQIVGAYIAVWGVIYIVGLVIIEYTDAPSLLPEVQVRNALNNDFERMQLRQFREEVLHRHRRNQDELGEDRMYADSNNGRGKDVGTAPFPEEARLYRKWLLAQEATDAAEFVAANVDVRDTRNDPRTQSYFDMLFPALKPRGSSR